MIKRLQCVGGPWDKHIIYLSTGRTLRFSLGKFFGFYLTASDKNQSACYWVEVARS